MRLLNSFQRKRRGFTLIELMIVILIIAILVGIAIPVYLAIQTKADNTRAEANLRIGNDAMGRIQFDIVDRGGNSWVDPDTGEIVDAVYMSARETKIHWYQFDPDPWPAFASIDPAMFDSIMIVTGADLDPSNSDHEELIVATVTRNGRVYFSSFYFPGGYDSYAQFEWDDGPPS